MNNHTKLRVLLLQLEFPTWNIARSWSYSAQLGIEEGLAANGVQFFTITTPWFSRARELCTGKQFDQVWLDIARHEELDETWLQWVAGLAPVRIGFMPESLEYYPEECAEWPQVAVVKQRAEERLKYVTHVVSCDEKDAVEINARGLVPAIWWPQAVPKRFIRERVATSPINKYAVFYGSIYGERSDWLEHPALKGLLIHPHSSESNTIYPALFEALHVPLRGPRRSKLMVRMRLLPAYLYFLRRIRRRCFARWLKALQNGCAVVNLPHRVKTYAGRVVEGMAAGRPVISWEIPARPQNKALFEDGREILLYSKNDPSQLAAHIQRILSEPRLGQRIAANALLKLKRFHTVEERVRQILNWVATGETPIYF